MTLPLIFNIHRFALDDGPGIRTTVFFKGCPLACAWCHNPEAISPLPEIAFHGNRCIGCGACGRVCPESAIHLGDEGRMLRDRCTLCGRCTDECPTMALERVGRTYTVNELVDLIQRDRILYETSGGGVTFSGGEPTQPMNYLGTVLRELKRLGIPTAIQTCGWFDWEAFERGVLPFVETIFFDLKLFDPALHKRYTGGENGRILDNFRRLSLSAPERLVPRIPLIPEVTATRENLSAMAAFLKSLGHSRCDLLPYNPGGQAKCATIGKDVTPWLHDTLMPRDEEDHWRQLFFIEFTGGPIVSVSI